MPKRGLKLHDALVQVLHLLDGELVWHKAILVFQGVNCTFGSEEASLHHRGLDIDDFH